MQTIFVVTISALLFGQGTLGGCGHDFHDDMKYYYRRPTWNYRKHLSYVMTYFVSSLSGSLFRPWVGQ
jgi:hypothetical protein